ncbi:MULTISPECIES: GntR family transcriptional regulator [unclassified Rhizobium]|uniref:GntR family transcriptional regulator n=1 Tax=unclassified Rhizobium TaxID=2613769 RepID=UPI001ADA87BB|nr:MULTISPECIES: GntR family transcriptional regulator [unclassified Rhizobium]MBO9102025.1 GntR family transcriptional regulator [Rhizobium sp. L58/93]MBO9136193.1 GntR family transcriptional regulator [Rhizobium sp. B209b/85]MBO9171853.1 GntR family transcriptional regulator [Rhizobium sp. L245/93]MBO9187975.1 GntR family transcriptional regulator [Rhizobium sp. E27B/91]QXZ86062.1 GntR family transcriptional regulator [Rhizobium sp. K1/93]
MALRSISPIVKMPIEVQATDALRDAIVNGGIAPGERITELQLSEEMGLSRATLRSALHQLAKEGLMTLIPYTGWSVISMTSVDVWELYTLRSAVERLAAQLVARAIDDRGTNVVQTAFASLVTACETANGSAIAAADFALHKAIIELTGHHRLIAQYGLIEQQIRISIRSSDALIASGHEIIEQHRPIVDAILGKNPELAGALSEQHNLTEGQKLSDHLRSREETTPPAGERKQFIRER